MIVVNKQKLATAEMKTVVSILNSKGITTTNGKIRKSDLIKTVAVVRNHISKAKIAKASNFWFYYTFEEVKFVPGLMFDVDAELGAIYEREEWGSGWLIEDIKITTPLMGINKEGEEVNLNLSKKDLSELEGHLLDLANKNADRIAGRAAKDESYALEDHRANDRD